MKTKFQQIDEARKTLNLPQRATMEEIKRNYKELINKWHPDKCEADKEICEKMTKKIVKAYEIILDYCRNYKYSFYKLDVEAHISYEEWWHRQFGERE